MTGQTILRTAGPGLALVLASAIAAAAAPSAYPNRPIRVIAPSAPGSPPDVVARIVGDRLAVTLGQPVIVENRPGAIGTIGLQAVSRATPDGYTFGMISMAYTLAPALLSQMPLDLSRDLAPVSQIAWGYHILVVRAASPVKSVNDLVAYAKAKPGQVTFASGGNATPAHIAGEFFRARAGVDIRHVPFKGAAAGTTAVMGEHVDMMFAAATAAAPLVKGGRLRALSTPAPQRIAAFPELPTMVELGFAGFEIRDWYGIVAPAGLPREIATRVAGEIAKVTTVAETRERLVGSGMEPVADSRPETFATLLRSELARWSRVVRDVGLKAD